jgi:16S rRNA (uracil1498-N3)-methyltransferase
MNWYRNGISLTKSKISSGNLTMARRRFYVPQDSIRDGIAILPVSQAHHLRTVLRIGAGETVEIFDGKGRGYAGEVELRDSEVVIRGLQSLPAQESSPRLTLAAALIKSDKFEWMLQKTTELGVDEIIPLITRLSDLRIPAGKIALRLDRWDRIAKEAARQSRRLTAPQIRAPLNFVDFLATDEFSECARFFFYEKARELWQPDPCLIANGVLLCIGPEGGWDADEVEQAREAGYGIFGLGPRILRAETAAVAAVSIIQYHAQLNQRLCL